MLTLTGPPQVDIQEEDDYHSTNDAGAHHDRIQLHILPASFPPSLEHRSQYLIFPESNQDVR